MTRRIAASLALVAFMMCLVTGLRAENSFITVVGRALLALGVTFIVGLTLGAMLEKMLSEKAVASPDVEKLSNAAAPADR